MQNLPNIWRKAEHHFSPIDFAMVMATGILSIAALLEGHIWMAKGLWYINIFFFIILFSLLLRRIFVEWATFVDDFTSYEKGPGVFTFVVALCILGDQALLLYGWYTLARCLLAIAFLSWLFIGYGFFFNITVTTQKKSLKDGINGSWLVSVVAIQALAVLIIYTEARSEIALFIATCLFFTGSVFYLYLMSLIIYRISFFDLHAKDLGAAYWINMGATAISTLAGSMLILDAPNFHLLNALIPFIKGWTLLFWSAGTWWIPLLILLGIWRHVVRKVKTPVSEGGYDPSYWAFVFPLGMYTASTYRLSEALNLDFLKTIPEYFFFIAFATWCAVMTGLVRSLLVKDG